MNRLGLSSEEFYQLTPAEFHYAIEDNDFTHWQPSKNICETIRVLGTIVHNSAFGRKKKDMVKNPKHLFALAWDTPTKKRQTVDEMKQTIQAIGLMFGTKKDKPTC